MLVHQHRIAGVGVMSIKLPGLMLLSSASFAWKSATVAVLLRRMSQSAFVLSKNLRNLRITGVA